MWCFSMKPISLLYTSISYHFQTKMEEWYWVIIKEHGIIVFYSGKTFLKQSLIQEENTTAKY